MQLLLLVGTFFALWSCTGSVRNTRFVLKVPARSAECFYEETTTKDAQIYLGVQVLRGGKLDIKLTIQNSKEEEVLSKLVAPRDFNPEILTLSENDLVYKICLDNTFSWWSEKWVHFVLVVHEREDYHVENASVSVDSEPFEHSPVLNEAKQTLARLRWQLLNVTSSQSYQRARDTRDRTIADSHNRRILMWSILEVVAIVFATLIQVIAISGILRTNQLNTGRP